MNLTTVIEALGEAYDSETPTSATKARKLTGSIDEKLEELKEWAAELADLVDSVESLAADLVAADRGEHDDAHTDWIGAVDQLRFHLREATAAPAPAPA